VKNQAALAYKTATLPGKENAAGKPLFPLAWEILSMSVV